MQAYSGEVVYIHEVVDSQKLKTKDQKQDPEPVGFVTFDSAGLAWGMQCIKCSASTQSWVLLLQAED